MKKQLWRFKQFADQTFLRGEKTEDLNYGELQIADQKVENLRNAVTAIVKRIPKSAQGNDVDKRAKKSVEYHLSTIFQEVYNRKGEPAEECQLLHYMLDEFCTTEYKLAKEYTEHELKIEDMVIEPLQKLIDNEFPSISKIKRGLSKYLLDLDSAFNRYQSTKKETVKDDVEEAHNKVEQTRDALAIEMFGLLARENELSSYVLQLMKLQRSYHESALKELEEVIPILEKKIGDSEVKRVFGVPLQEHLRVKKKRLALPLEICITKMLKLGMSEEGLLRITGSSSRVKRFRSAIDSGCLIQMIPEYTDVHMLASTLKSYLRQLPEPILTSHLYNDWLHIGMMCKQQCSEQQKIEAAKKLIAKLPKENQENLAYVVQFLAEIPRHPLVKMNASNIAIVMGPNLLWDNSNADRNMENCSIITAMVEFLIKGAEVLFPEDVSKYVSLPKSLLQDFDTESMSKSAVQFSKETEYGGDINVSTENIHIIDSPRPNSRKKKTVAPVPPTNPSKTDEDISNERVSLSTSYPSYPSGSSTLNRPPKSKEAKIKTSTGTNTGDDFLTPSRRKSLTHDDTHKNSEVPKSANLVSLDTKTVDHKYVTQPAVSTQVSKATPVQPVTAQNANCDKIIRTTATHQMHPLEEHRPMKPVALPRSIVQDGEKHVSVSRTSSMRSDVMSKSANEILDGVQLRKSEPAERAAKPEVPARPASLLQKRFSIDSQLDPALHKTTVYSVAHKQQPSIVNLQNRPEKLQPGHDNNMAEKEKFLGHQPDKAVPMPRASLENKFGDINSNCSNNKLPKPAMRPNERLNKSNERLNVSKSNEKLNDSREKLNENGNQKPSHVRTRSDGNLVDLRDGNVPPISPHTPLSPRGLSKPTQPPPPPPVNVNKAKKDSDSTDL